MHEINRPLLHRGPVRASTVVAFVVAALAAHHASSVAGAAVVPRIVEGHHVPAAGEHPRLIVRKGQGVATLRRAAASPWGQRIKARIRQALKLMEKLAIAGRNREVIKEAGFKAAGYGAVFLLDADAAAANKARQIALREVVGYPMAGSLGLMDRVSRLHGTAVAYDLCYDAWDGATRRKVRAYLLQEAQALLKKVGRPDAASAAQPEHITAWASAGLAELAALGDADDGARARVEACERALTVYLDRNIGELGFDANGESVRQAAFASGILPFFLANRLVLGRDFTQGPAVSSVMLPMVYQTVPGVGMAVTGAPTATVDSTGLFALATELTPAERRPAVAWLLQQIGGNTYLGIIRPHHGLHMLTSGLSAVKPAPPGGRWPRFVRSDRARFAVFRSRWQDADDIVAVAYGGAIRILGMGAHWVGHRGLHAAMWSHDPGAGSLENVFLFNPRMLKKRVYRISVTSRLAAFRPGAAAPVASAAFTFEGRADRARPTLSTSKKKGRQKVTTSVPVPEGGSFEGTRVFGVDYTGRCGAPALFILADRLTGGGKAPRVWVLHVGPEATIAADGPTFTLTSKDASLRGTVVYPQGVTFQSTGNHRFANFLSAKATSDRFEVIMTLQLGEPPKVAATDKGLSANVTVGKRVVLLRNDEIAFTQ